MVAAPEQTVDIHAPAQTAIPGASDPLTTPMLPTITLPKTEIPPATLAPDTYLNPVLDQDFPDPDILKVDGHYYAFSTNSGSTNIQVAQSADLVRWKFMGEALPRLPAWAVQDFGWVWAPEVTTDASGEVYLMYYTARFAIGSGGTQCIGLATSLDPAGPFEPVGEEPFICQTEEGGSIDAASFKDEDGKAYLLWKNDGNSRGVTTWIYIQRLSEDGLSLEGEPTRLIKPEYRWEGNRIEGPVLWKQAGQYFLFHSANDFQTPKYTIGYAVADHPMGPYQKAESPLLVTDLKAGVVGPGGQDITLSPSGETWILFHGWTPQGTRNLYLARLEWEDGKPKVSELSRGPLTAP